MTEPNNIKLNAPEHFEKVEKMLMYASQPLLASEIATRLHMTLADTENILEQMNRAGRPLRFDDTKEGMTVELAIWHR